MSIYSMYTDCLIPMCMYAVQGIRLMTPVISELVCVVVSVFWLGLSYGSVGV